jgi:outer membrane receptor protein involved in Fe transport
MVRCSRSSAAAVLLLLLIAPALAAQTVSGTTGAINGTVTDATKSVLPGVTVTLSGPAVMGAPTAVTDQNGFFRFQALAPADYKLTFELAGFGGAARDAIHVSLGFTATVNVEMSPASVTENVTVSGASPVVDLQATNVTTHFDADKLASLPGSRDFWGVIAQAPAVSMSRVDVGGSGALTQQPYTAYGLSSGGGVNRGEVEGVMVNEGAGGGGSDMYYTDYGSYAEIAVNAVGNTAEMPSPGVLSQLIAKSGGNVYHGDLYADYENDSMEAHNIDSQQIAKGLSGSNALSVNDLNRLTTFKDFDVDLGGFIVKDRLWWYGAARHTVTGQRYPTLVDDVQETTVPVYTGKATYNLNAQHKVIGFYQHANKHQPDYLGAILIPGGRTTSAIMHANTVWDSTFPTNVWKVEYDAVLSNSLFLEVRTGQYHTVWQRVGKSADPRVEDIGNNLVAGGLYGTTLDRSRPQVNGALSYSRSGWAGAHNFKIGGEVMRDSLVQPFVPFAAGCDCISVFNNGAPTQVYLYQGANTSRNGEWSDAIYANDTWQLNRRVTLNLGIRYDRQRAYLPDQQGPAGQSFAAVDSAVAWNNWGPRLGVSADVSGDGKTLVKGSFGQFWLYPGADFAATLNANPAGWFKQYAWTDANRNGVWDPGEEGRLISVSGGSLSTALDPQLKNTFTRQATAYVEREVAANLGVRTGFVWNGRRQVRATINQSRPIDAYSVPVRIQDPGADGRVGTADDGGLLDAFNLSAAALAVPPVNITTNIPADSDYYTWEVTATKRETGRWSLLASFAETWNRETTLAGGASFTPNALINTADGRNRYQTWQGKVSATLKLAWDWRVTPIVRHQSGMAFGRTFVSSLNYGTATVLAEPFGAERAANINVFDVRTEKAFVLPGRGRIVGFFDVYNILNTNAEQAVAVGSGASFLRPSAITPPRLARVGVKLQW